MKYKVIGMLLLSIFFLFLVSADYDPHKINTGLDYSFTSNKATQCNLTSANTPHGVMSIEQIATKNGQTFNLSIGEDVFTEQGIYCFNIECTDGTTIRTGSFCRDVTTTGHLFTQARSMLYIGLLSLMVLIFIGTFILIGYLPAYNERDEEGRILSINYLKYLRLPLWIFLYFLLSGIIFLSSNIALAYLGEVMFGNFLFTLFSVLLALSPVIIIVILISFFVKFFHDKEFQRMLNRGVFPQGRL
jgi:hypothetical protein